MTTAPRMCFDKVLPTELFRGHELFTLRDGPVFTRALLPPGKKWTVGSTLRVRFLGGTSAQRDMVRRFAPRWSEFANLKFEFGDSPQAEIRITFDPEDGAWSYLGTDCSGIPAHAATMNLGWVDEAVILHEFGHAVGLAHEHQNPDGGIEWNEEAVIRDLGGPPNFWDPQTVRHNVLDKYQNDQVNGTRFDARSIMLYAFPGTWTKSGKGTEENQTLSELDKSFIASPAAYPGKGKPVVAIPTLPVAEVQGVAASISKGGELDHFTFQVSRPGSYTVETLGTTDVVMRLFGPNNDTNLMAEDDDSGAGSNARIEADLIPGKYVVQVRHYDPTGTGDFQIRVFF